MDVLDWNEISHTESVYKWSRSLEIYRLAKFSTLTQTVFFQFLSSLCTYLWDIHSLKNNSAVSRSGYFWWLFGLNQNFSLTSAFVFIWNEGTFLKYIYKKLSIASKIYVKIPSVLPNIARCSVYKTLVLYVAIGHVYLHGYTYLHIYMAIGNAYLHGLWCFIIVFPITCYAKKLQCKCSNNN